KADAVPAPVKFAALADAGLAAARVHDVVSDLSAVPGLDFVILAGNVVGNADAAKTEAEVKELASAFGILPAKKYVVLGKRAKAIVDAPSLAKDGAYVSATLDKLALVERVLTPGNPAPRLETKHALK